MAILQIQEQVGSYKVLSLIKSNHYTETYKVEDNSGKFFFLKLFVLNRMPATLINQDTKIVKEIECCKDLEHQNLIRLIEYKSFNLDSGIYQYYVTDYFMGDILSDKLMREGAFPEEKALAIFRGIIVGLGYLHSQTPSLCHNDLDPSNIMLSDTIEDLPVIIDYGHLSTRCSGHVPFDTSDLNPIFHAKETMVGIFDEQGDIFSACAILYTMLTGSAPWNQLLQEEGSYKERFKSIWMYRQKNPLDIDGINVTSKAKYILQKGLALKAADRFANVNDILSVLDSQNAEIDGEPSTQSTAPHKQQDSTNAMQDPNTISIDIQRGGGNGFADIAGMQELKDYLTKTVIFFMKNKDIAQQYGITPPNGMLLYGPPGCGKTFFAEKFAEETGFNFMLVKSSDVGSSLVHGTQEKVKKLFKQAEKNSPIVLCFDEFDAIVPDRGARGNEYVASEVNEFLSQMNNCSKRGIFIVATSNRPDKIDPAILRTGRIDKQVYVPLPDLEARKEMFKMYLNNRPVEGEFDIDSFAKRTEGYIASDIAFIVNDAAMTAAFTRKPITADLLNTAITNTRPSLQKEVIEEYSYIRNRMDGIARRNVVTGL